jgi:RNA polymerase sigma-70 factor (ECF subfamily)
MTDAAQEWVEQARQGNQQAFRHLVEAHARPLFGVCMRITRDATLAEDAVQEALYNAWRHLADFDGRASFTTWLHRIAVNAALEQLRRNARHVHAAPATLPADEDSADFLDLHADDAPGPEAHARGREIHLRTQAELDGMSALERAAFVMRHVEGESLEAIAATLSLNIGQSKQAIFRAVRKLRGALQGLR